MKYGSFEDMQVWKDAMELAVKMFEWSEGLPKKEDYGLTSQVRRSALSVSANTAEGFGRHHVADKLNFYYHTRGSLYETQGHLMYAQRVKYLSEDLGSEFYQLVRKITVDIGKLISALTAMKTK
jgi:four helix bundle protein